MLCLRTSQFNHLMTSSWAIHSNRKQVRIALQKRNDLLLFFCIIGEALYTYSIWCMVSSWLEFMICSIGAGIDFFRGVTKERDLLFLFFIRRFCIKLGSICEFFENSNKANRISNFTRKRENPNSKYKWNGGDSSRLISKTFDALNLITCTANLRLFIEIDIFAFKISALYILLGKVIKSLFFMV